MATKPKTVSKSSGSNTVTTVTTTKTVTKGKTVTKKTTVTKPAPASSGKTTTTPAKLARAPLGESWICGPNEKYPLCWPVALANSLLALTGIRATSADLERLYRAAGGSGDSGVALAPLVAAAKLSGLAGCRLENCAPVPAAGGEAAGLVLLLTLPGSPDLHATATAGDGRAVFWGEPYPTDDLAASVTGAWSLSWR